MWVLGKVSAGGANLRGSALMQRGHIDSGTLGGSALYTLGQESIGSHCTVRTATSVNWHQCGGKSSAGTVSLWRLAQMVLAEETTGSGRL